MAYEFKFVCSKCRSADVDIRRAKDLDLEAAGKIKLEMACTECHHVESLTQIEAALHWLRKLEKEGMPFTIRLEVDFD